MSSDIIILGGGAAGLFCAIEAGKQGRRVTVLEHASEVGKKILISGGGRCNFTNLHCRPENFLSANPHFCKSALARYTPHDFIELVRKYGIAYHEKTLGQLFCDSSARQIVEMLKAECTAGNVEIVTDCRVQDVTLDREFLVATSQGTYQAKALVVATGGLSIPKIGATDIGYRIARKFGLKLQPCRPALVPLLYPEHVDLAGVATEVIASFNGQAFREKLLITHRGLSGPAILQISSYWDGRGEIDINLLPSVGIEAELLGRKQQGEKAEVRSVLAEYLPRRLAERWAQGSGPLIVAGNKAIVQLTENLHHWRVLPTGTEGYEKAEVTGGGVDTGELSAKTMEARKVPGLYFIGEVVDVTGHLGGFNFQWAWSSGYSAGQVAGGH